jgi:endonuclease YncB( thermonuclease family)
MKRLLSGIECCQTYLVLLTALLLAAPALAQEMPPPHKAPRTPVNQQALDNDKPALRSRDLKGPAAIIDGERLQVTGIDLRLFGVVPPQLSASFGPQARAVLDEITQGQNVECHVRDRDHDGHFLATCMTENTKIDLGLELLKRGLAVTARGSVQPTDLAAPYEAAEQAAEAQRIGLWSVAPPAPAALPATAPPAAVNAAPVVANSNVPPLPSELKKDEKPVTQPAKASVPVAPRAEKVVSSPPPVVVSAPADDEGVDLSGFFGRYQLLLTGLVILMTALGILVVLAVERRRDRRDEMKAIAAALRGELLAARAVCQARLKTWTEADERSAAWPRIRATLYQAYVGKLGWLGAVLARQIASIYGQATDYAAYFNPSTGATETREAISKRYALQTLIQHIEEVLPKLASVEQTGTRPKGVFAAKTTSAAPVQDRIGVYAPPRITAISMLTRPLRNLMKKFAPAPQTDNRSVAEEAIADYTTVIEEEIARMSAEEGSAPPSNVTRMRG